MFRVLGFDMVRLHRGFSPGPEVAMIGAGFGSKGFILWSKPQTRNPKP